MQWNATCAKYPNKACVVFDNTSYTFREMDVASNRIANWAAAVGTRRNPPPLCLLHMGTTTANTQNPPSCGGGSRAQAWRPRGAGDGEPARVRDGDAWLRQGWCRAGHDQQQPALALAAALHQGVAQQDGHLRHRGAGRAGGGARAPARDGDGARGVGRHRAVRAVAGPAAVRGVA